MPSINDRHCKVSPLGLMEGLLSFYCCCCFLFLQFSVLTITPCLFFFFLSLKIGIISSFVHFVFVFKIPFSVLFSLKGTEQGLFLACAKGRARSNAHMRIFSEELRKYMISSLSPFPTSSISGSWGGKTP